MSLRIFHTADNHIGISFHRYPEVARKRQIAERFASLERLVTTANERKADFFMVEGDLFDKTSVTRAQVGRTVQILGKLEGEAVLVLAGNHDFSEGSDSKLWMQFRAAADGSRIRSPSNIPETEKRWLANRSAAFSPWPNQSLSYGETGVLPHWQRLRGASAMLT